MPERTSVVLVCRDHLGRRLTLTELCWREKIQDKHHHPDSYLDRETPECVQTPDFINIDKNAPARCCYYREIYRDERDRTCYVKVVDFRTGGQRLDEGAIISVLKPRPYRGSRHGNGQMTEYDWTIHEDALADLPENWADEFARKVNDPGVWLGHDATLGAGYLWFTTDRSNAVHIPIYDNVEIVIDDATREVIGVVIYHLRTMAELVTPLSERMLIAAGKMRPPRMDQDIPMQPYRDLVKKQDGRGLIRTFAHMNARPAPLSAD